MNATVARSRLEQRRKQLKDRLVQLTPDVRHSQGLESDFSEQAVQRENDDVLEKLDTATRAEIGLIDKALGRLDEQRYGICEACRRPIAPERMEAVPYATRCLRCQVRETGRKEEASLG